MKVIFIPVKEGKQKLSRLVGVVESHFYRKDPLFLLVEDLPALEFVDELLWKPLTSFLPHPSPLLKIGIELELSFFCVFNLKGIPIAGDLSLKVVYEFEDTSSPDKQGRSKEKFDWYRSRNYHLILDSISV